MKKVLLIDKKKFFNWYFDQDMIEDFFYSQGILNSLINKGLFTITADELLEGIGYLPEQVVAEGQNPILDDLDEINMNEYDEIKFA